MALALAKEVCASTESLQVDLKGLNANQALEFVKAAFVEERSLTQMIKVTLLVGAGKHDRARYDDDLAKWVMNALREIGYQEDKGASCDFLCAGSHKFQHDTGKNLKFVQVFPRAKEAPAEDDGIDEEGVEEGAPEGFEDAEWYIVVSSVEVFEKMVKRKMPAWIHKKRCSVFLKEIQEEIDQAERKMMAMKEMTPREHRLYTEVQNLSDKVKLLTAAMKSMVEAGQLTSSEIGQLISQIDTKLEKVETELEAAKGKPAIDRLLKVKEALTERKERLSKLNGIKHPLLEEKAMKALIKKIIPLEKLEKKAGAKGLWSSKLSPAEVAMLREKEEYDADLRGLIYTSRCWFEEEEEFQARYNAMRSVLTTRAQRKDQNAQGTSKKGGSTSGWSTVGNKNKNKKVDFNKLIKKKPNTGGFNALMD